RRGHAERLADPQPGDLPRWADLAELEADRWSVPEPFSAVARVLRARGEAAADGAARGHPPRLAAGATQRGAAALVFGRRAGRLGGAPGPGGRPRGPAGSVLRRAAGDRLQPGVRPRRPGEHRVRRGRAQADLAAAARAARAHGGRRLQLPGDADT